MKIHFSKSRRSEGSVLIVAMGIVAVVGMILGSYLTLVEGQSDSVYRSQSYNAAIPVAEAGLEEGLTLLNKYYPNVMSSGGSWTNNLTADGWSSISSSNTTSKSNRVYGSNYYLVTISNSPGGSPVVFSTGVVLYIQNSWGGLMASNKSLASSVIALARTLEIQTTANSLFGATLGAKGDISFSGGVNVDSFNSGKTNLSANGQYSPLKKNDQATIATGAGVNSAISGTGAVQIRGYINTGTNGSVGESGGFSAGDNNWVSNGTAGIELSRSNDTFNAVFPDISSPSATFVLSPSSGTVSGTNYAEVFQGNQYWGSSNVMYQTSVSLTGQQHAIVTGGAVVLYVPQADTFSFSGQSSIYISPGSSLVIYCGASSVSLTGGSFMGATNAGGLSFYGLPTCTAVKFTGSSSFVGTIYAPEADFNASGGATFIGAMVANSFTFSGGAAVHYDENLANTGPSTGYVATRWQELRGQQAFYKSIVP